MGALRQVNGKRTVGAKNAFRILLVTVKNVSDPGNF
jgi:hypothetical protein